MAYTEEQIATFAKEFNETKDTLKELVSDRVIGNFIKAWGSDLQFIRIDALNTEDYPNGIAENSIYIQFAINYATHKVELHGSGHVYLSPKDLQLPQYKYLAMKSVVNVGVDKGIKKFRKSKFKDGKDLAKKLATYYNSVMECVNEYTGGYLYKKGIEE